MAVLFKKENGYPMDIRIETNPFEEVMENNNYGRLENYCN